MAKSTKKSKKNKKAKKKNELGFKKKLFKTLFKWILVIGLWCGIILSCIIGWYATELPSIINSPHFERRTATTILAKDNSQIARYGELKGISVEIEDIPPHLIYAVMAVEDRRFYNHFGIDPIGLLRAVVRNLKEGGVVQGGSTITQQLAKNLFLSHERTYKRKIQEAMLALWLEKELTKDEILTAYLNRVYLGAGTYGVDAAAKTYFSTSIKDLSLYQSAMLAGLLKAPSRYSPQSNPTLAASRAKVVLNAMVDAGYITEEEAENQSLQAQASLSKPTSGNGERYFTDWITANLDELVGNTDSNMTVYSTLDTEIQKAAEDALAETIRQYGEEKNISQGAIVVMARDGAILAMAGGVDYQESQFNRATQALRPPGSSFKPVVYLAALETGMHPEDEIIDEPIKKGRYRPKNFANDYAGETTLIEALTNSRNTVAVNLMQIAGVNNVIRLAHAMGITSKLQPDLSLSLGSSGVPLIEMVTAYGTIVNGGIATKPYAINKITNDDKTLLYVHTDTEIPHRAASREATGYLRDMMMNVIENGTGRRARLPFRAAGKTGTSQDFRDAWFIGFTDKFIAGVWLGNDDNSEMKHVTGGSMPADIWRKTMLAAHRQSGYRNSAAGMSDEWIIWNDDEKDTYKNKKEERKSFIKKFQYIFND